MQVLVIGLNGRELMPTTPRKARQLLSAGKAVIVRQVPFTIQLLYKTGVATQPQREDKKAETNMVSIEDVAGERSFHLESRLRHHGKRFRWKAHKPVEGSETNVIDTSDFIKNKKFEKGSTDSAEQRAGKGSLKDMLNKSKKDA